MHESRIERCLLADQEYVNSTKVEVIVERKSGETVICGMHASIKLNKILAIC